MEIQEISLSEVLQIASGTDKNGVPQSAATLAIDKVHNDVVETLDLSSIYNAEMNFFSSGGCAVVEINFPRAENFNYMKTIEVCKKWMASINNCDFNDHIMTFAVVPIALKGQIVLVFSNLVYYTGVETQLKNQIVLCFDNEATNILESDDIDYNNISMAVHSEIRMEEDKIRRQIKEIEESAKEKDRNLYEESLEEVSKIDTHTIDSDKDVQRDIRISTDWR